MLLTSQNGVIAAPPSARAVNCWVRPTWSWAEVGAIVIGPRTRNALRDVAVPREAVTTIEPVVAPGGTEVEMRLPLTLSVVASVPLKDTPIWAALVPKPLP